MNAKQKKIIAVFNFSDKEYQYRLRKENVNQMEWLFASDNEHHHEGRETYSQRKWFPGTSGKVFSKVFFGRIASEKWLCPLFGELYEAEF